jgi:squalene-associated FAD-dependent desaturase
MQVHVIGAGLAGLSAALAASSGGARVMLYEASPQAGGRCRSFHDETLGVVIDNGGHVVLGANAATLAFLDAVGGRTAMRETAPAAVPFMDLASGETWVLRPNRGPLPWWLFVPSRRVAGSRLADSLGAFRLLCAPSERTVREALGGEDRLTARLWEPLCTAIMNTPPTRAAARPFARVLRATLFSGEAACRTLIAARGLSAAFADPALRRLERLGVEFQSNRRLTGISVEQDRVTRLIFVDRDVAIGPNDAAVLAVPANVAGALLPGLAVPDDFEAIVNAHYRLEEPVSLPGGLPLLGLVGGLAQWLIARENILSATVSAAGGLVDEPPESLTQRLWSDIARALRRPDRPVPPARLIKERRATIAQTPAAERLRPRPATKWRNLALAGDWVATGWPATIEGAILSGSRAWAALQRA